MRRIPSVLALAAVCLLVAVAAPAEDACRPAWGVALDGLPIDELRLARARAQTGLPPRLVVFFLQWPPPGREGAFPADSLTAIARAGAVPVLTWEPMYLDEAGRERAIAARSILEGDYDAYIAGFARRARAWGGRFIVRFGHEMNLARYHWGGDPADYGPASPALYARMFRHVVDVFRAQGADGALWAFCPNAESNPHPRWHGAAWNRPEAYYPGEGYVDILGMDGYNWGLTQTREKHGWQSRWQGFPEIFGELRATLTALAPNKPLVVFETSSAGAGGDRDAWLAEAVRTCRSWGVAGLAWFQAAKEVDWRLTAERDAAARALLAPLADCPFALPPGGPPPGR